MVTMELILIKQITFFLASYKGCITTVLKTTLIYLATLQISLMYRFVLLYYIDFICFHPRPRFSILKTENLSQMKKLWQYFHDEL